MAGLAPDTIRQAGPVPQPLPDGVEVIIEEVDGDDIPQFDDNGKVLTIEHGDGSVTVSLDGKSLVDEPSKGPADWFDNLADQIADDQLSQIAETLLRGIEDDIESRKDWIEANATGIRLLGLQIEVPGLQGASDGAPVEGMSKVRHPLLLEAVLRFQANARGELLPADGPVKIRNDDNNANLQEDQIANAFEKDMNHYLTAVATEYYPDTDRMLFKLGFQGTQFKKVYFCPLRSRPVSETVSAEDLIVNNAATDLGNAKRITHDISMRPSVVKRMQILGVYRDLDLAEPQQAKKNEMKLTEDAQQGISDNSINAEDRNRQIYECYCELDIPGFEHKLKGVVTGLEVPYRVTIDVSSRQILSIVRNYDEPDESKNELPMAKEVFVKYTFVPGLGFYDIGLLHILGNSTNALTAAWRELLDSGMYANFPGFLIAKNGTRQNTNIFRVPPGGGAQVDTGGMPIGQSIMPLPYNAQAAPALLALVQEIETTGTRIGGTSELQVGEGRADAPVGTTLAMIEQATKVLDSVHKRLHASQAREFQLLVKCFKEHPESFIDRKCKSNTKWDEQTFVNAINNCELVPQADPNTASHGQRVMKIMALKQLQMAQPQLYDPIAIDTAALQAIGWSNPSQFFAPPQAQASPPPQLLQMQADMKAKQDEANARLLMSQAKMEEVKAKTALGAFNGKHGDQQAEGQAKMLEAQAKMLDAQTRKAATDAKNANMAINDQHQDLDRQTRERIATMNLVKDLIPDPIEAAKAMQMAESFDRNDDQGR